MRVFLSSFSFFKKFTRNTRALEDTLRGWLVWCMQLNQTRQMQISQDWFIGPPPQPGCAHAKDASRPGCWGTSKSAVSREPSSGGASVSAWESVQTQKITFTLDMQPNSISTRPVFLHRQTNQAALVPDKPGHSRPARSMRARIWPSTNQSAPKHSPFHSHGWGCAKSPETHFPFRSVFCMGWAAGQWIKVKLKIL